MDHDLPWMWRHFGEDEKVVINHQQIIQGRVDNGWVPVF